jgi:transposase
MTKKKSTSKKTTLTNNERIDVIKLFENENVPFSNIAAHYQVSTTAIRRTIKRKKEIEDYLSTENYNGKQKRRRKSKYPSIEKELIEWIEHLRIWKFPVTSAIIKTYARELALKSGANEFTCSNGWFEGFKSRFALRSIKLVGEAGSSKVMEQETKLFEISEKISTFPIDCVYNMDEAGIFYRILPEFSYILPSELGARGTKKDKNRLTAIFCANATGTHKLPLTVIGKSKNPTCFSGKEVLVNYVNSKKAWINSKLFQLWFENIFAKEVLQGKQKDEKILLILDNCSAHLQIQHEQIETIFLPPNVTSTCQPFDQGIISTVKRTYRMKMLQDIINSIEAFKQMEKRKRKKSGISLGGKADIYDASVLLKQSWDQISASTICRCWMKSNLLSPLICAQLRSNLEPKQNVSKKDDQLLRMICANLEIFCIESIKTKNQNPNETIEQLQEDIEHWIDIEQDASILFPEVEEQIAKKDGKDLNCKNDKKGKDKVINQYSFELQQAKKEATDLVQFFTEKKWRDLNVNIDDDEVNILTSLLSKFISSNLPHLEKELPETK